MVGDNMERLNEETFTELIVKEYEEWCGFMGEAYLRDDDTDEDLFEFVSTQIDIDDKFRIEELNDEGYNAWRKFFDKIDKEPIWDIVWEYNHPWSDWDNCDADFYGV